MRYLTVLLLLGLMSARPLSANSRHILHWTTEDGLPSNKVYCATQSSQGFIWFGTDNGLARFDGSSFKIYTVKDGLPDNDIFTVFEDSYNRLWVLSLKQAPCFFFKNKLYTIANDTFLNKNFKDPDMYKFIINRAKKRILFLNGEKNTLNVIEYPRITRIKVENAAFFIKGPASSLFCNNEDDYLFIRDNYIMLRNGKEIKTRPYKSFLNCDQVNYNGVEYGISNTLSEKMLHLFRAEKDSLVVLKQFTAKNEILGPTVNPQKSIFFLDDLYNLISFDFKTMEWVHVTKLDINGRLSTSYIDRNGNLYICTHDNGFYILPQRGAEIISAKNGANCLVYSEYLKSIICGYEDKSIQFYKSGKIYKSIQFEKRNRLSSRITGLASVNENLVVSGDFQTIIYSLKKNKIIYTLDGTNMHHRLLEYVKDLEPCDSNRIIISSSHGAGIFELPNLTMTDSIWNTRTTAVLKVKGRGIYLGTINGLYFRPEGKKDIIKIQSDPLLSKSRITDIKSDQYNNVWVGTSQYGLFAIRDNGIVNYNESDNYYISLSSYYVKSIYIDDKGIVWIATDKGLNRITHTRNYIIKIHRISSTFLIPDENINSVLEKNDTIYSASLSGINSFCFNRAYLGEIPSISISSIQQDKTFYSIDKELKFPFNKNSLSVNIAAVALQGQKNILFLYRLVGLEDKWFETTNQKIDFISLEPGQYRFEVLAINTVTSEKSKVKGFSFTVLEPWYRNRYLWILLIILSLLITRIAVLNRIRNIRQKSEEINLRNKQMAELEMQAVRAQMNPHFIFNALTAIQNYYINSELEKANSYMSRFAKLIRQMLTYSKKNFICIQDEIQVLENYLSLEKIRFVDKFDYRINLDPSIDTKMTLIPAMLIQPILENSINHGIRAINYPGLIELNIRLSDQTIVAEIIDNGIGLEKTKSIKRETSNGIGLQLIKRRINKLNEIYKIRIEFDIRDRNPDDPKLNGTVVRLTFPSTLIQD